MQFSLSISFLAILSVGVLLHLISASTTLSQSDLSVSGAALAKCDRSTIVDPQYPTTGPLRLCRNPEKTAPNVSTFTNIHLLRPDSIYQRTSGNKMPCRPTPQGGCERTSAPRALPTPAPTSSASTCPVTSGSRPARHAPLPYAQQLRVSRRCTPA